MTKKKKKVAKSKTPLDFEAAVAELEQIVERLEDGDLGLTESLDQYERGVQFLKQCFDLLSNAEKRIAMLTGVDAEGQPIGESFDEPAESLEEKAAGRSRRRSADAKPANKKRQNVVDDQGGLF